MLSSLLFYGITLKMTYFCAELVQLNCQPKWLGTWSAEIWREEKYSYWWCYHVGKWIV